MIFILLLVASLYLFYKWGVSNNDYFIEKGVVFSKPVFLFGSNGNMLFNRMSLPDVVQKWYNEFKNEK